ncbi:peptidase U62 modulator of DNA gyrase [Desulfofarcimen acetoxidans DSM 771]|uniref:Peptidase U62 modulator of DNA gyrase n=1 Tax=Desulfofarcimen acetoxidans (strain ATCC 49208 / DSM 771 / KCTC 5769 / VKM B-1644 / 5575) TaxID=485916 RepID=C8W181_DESAS|nr:TldD/PmbA family protein [Desulfofarcimen acetoxidans]ACV63477.1 peptidase U62 modulator of DNA gyrase [Desulfofarcimen acetoxidans DSM 771]
MFDKKLLQKVLAASMSKGGDFADIFIENKKAIGIRCEAGKIERIHSGMELGAGIRVLSGENTAFAYTNDVSENGLLAAAKTVSSAVQGKQRDINIDLRTIKPVVAFDFPEPPGEVSTARKVSLVEDADKSARSIGDEAVKQVIVGYGDATIKVNMANSNGEYIEDERMRTRLLVQVVASDNDVIQTGYDAVGGLSGFELFKIYDPHELAVSVARRAVSMLSAKPAPAGKMPVVMSGEAGGTMVHEACGHGLEADLIQKELSVYAGKKGQKVASDLVSVIDDATMSKKYGSYAVDDEGILAEPVTLIKNGVLEDYLYDRLSAKKDNRKSNGHGRRESYQHKPIPRMGNTYIAQGKTDPEKIIRETKSGLLIKKMGGGQVNTTTGDFVFDVAEGYLIQNGDVGPMVRGATLTGNGPQVLQIIDMVGSDLGFSIGTCGKDGQGVPVSDAQPTIHIPEIVVGGTSHDADGSEQIKQIRRL